MIPRILMTTLLSALVLLPFVASTALSQTTIEWMVLSVNADASLTDGGGMTRKVHVDRILYRADVTPSPLIVHMTIDGEPRVARYGFAGAKPGTISQISVNITGETPAVALVYNEVLMETVTIIAEVKAPKIPNRKGATWTLAYGSEKLVGIIGPEVQRSTSGTDERSFAALTCGVLSMPAVLQAAQNGGEAAASASSAIKILGGLLGGGVKGGVRCSKKKITTLACTAQCAASADGTCGCECMGIPCCSACEQREETVWEYSAGVGT